MNIEELRNFCISKKGAEECFPFDHDTLVFKVMNKIFLITDIQVKPISFNVKCEPLNALELREKYPCVKPGFHMNKKHWNTIVCDGSVSSKIIKQWVDESYNLIVNSLPKKSKEEMSRL